MTSTKLDTASIWPTHGVVLGVGGALHYVPLRGTDYVVPAHFTVFFGDPRLPYDVELEVTMDESAGPECVNLNARRRPEEPAVSAVGLRALPLAALLEQASRFMAYQVTEDADGTPKLSPAKATPESLQQIQQAWRWARAAPRRAAFPPDNQNLKQVADLVRRALKEAKADKRRPRVYADVVRWLAADGNPVSRATVQRRIEEAQERGFAPRWTEGAK